MESWLGGCLSPTKYKLKRTPERVTITRCHHPLQGESFDVLMEGDERIVIRLANGTSMRILRCWTDADGVPDMPTEQPRTLCVDSLRALIIIVDGLCSSAD